MIIPKFFADRWNKLFFCVLFLSPLTALAELGVDAGNDACVQSSKLSNSMKFGPSSPEIDHCSKQAVKQICETAAQKLEQSAKNSAKANNGKKLIPNCGGPGGSGQTKLAGEWIKYGDNGDALHFEDMGNGNSMVTISRRLGGNQNFVVRNSDGSLVR